MAAVARSCAAAVLSFLLLSCTDATGPSGPPYLAIVANLYALGGASMPGELRYKVSDLGDIAARVKRLHAAPADTIIIPLRPAAYRVELEGLPARCVVSNGTTRDIALTELDNTGIIRYSIQCRSGVSITVGADGQQVDSGFVYRVRRSDGEEFTGLVAANDTVAVDDATSGTYDVQIGGIAPNCIVLSDGGPIQHVDVSATGGAIVTFRVRCSDLAHRPQLLSFVSGYDGAASVFTFKVWDPDHDLDGYTWDITDCHGSSVLPEARERTRRGLRSGRGQLSDTLEVIGAYEVGIAPAEMIGRCTELRVFDEHSNTSAIVTHRIGSATGHPPSVRFFNATLQGTAYITSLLLASDPENDIVGHFVLVRLRDGVLAPPDGIADLGSMDPAGYVTLDVPLIPTTGRIAWDDVLGVIVYVIDRTGNVVRMEDADVIH